MTRGFQKPYSVFLLEAMVQYLLSLCSWWLYRIELPGIMRIDCICVYEYIHTHICIFRIYPLLNASTATNSPTHRHPSEIIATASLLLSHSCPPKVYYPCRIQSMSSKHNSDYIPQLKTLWCLLLLKNSKSLPWPISSIYLWETTFHPTPLYLSSQWPPCHSLKDHV